MRPLSQILSPVIITVIPFFTHLDSLLVNGELLPDKDVVWLEVPFSGLLAIEKILIPRDLMEKITVSK